jgi:hypothetical protein
MFRKEVTNLEKFNTIDYEDFAIFLRQIVDVDKPSLQDLRELNIQFNFRSYQIETYLIYYLRQYLNSKKPKLSISFLTGKLIEGLISTKNYFPAYEALFDSPPNTNIIKIASGIFYDVFAEYRFARQELCYLNFKTEIIEARSEYIDSKREQKSKKLYFDISLMVSNLEHFSSVLNDVEINDKSFDFPEEYTIASLDFYNTHYPEAIKPFPESDFFCVEFANVFVSICRSFKSDKKMSFYNLELAMQEGIKERLAISSDRKIELDLYYSKLFKNGPFGYIRTYFSQIEMKEINTPQYFEPIVENEQKYIPGDQKLKLLISFVNLQAEETALITREALKGYFSNKSNKIYFSDDGSCAVDGLIDENKMRPLFSIIKNLQDFGLELSNTKAAPYIRQIRRLIDTKDEEFTNTNQRPEEISSQTIVSKMPIDLRRLRISFDRSQSDISSRITTTNQKEVDLQLGPKLTIKDYQDCDVFELHKVLVLLRENTVLSLVSHELISELESLINDEFEKMSLVASCILQENPLLTDVQILNSISRNFTNKPLVSNGKISNFGNIIMDKLRSSKPYSSLETFDFEDVPGIRFKKQAKKDFEKLEKIGKNSITNKIKEALVSISNIGGWGKFVESVAIGDSLGYGWHKGEENFKNCILLDVDRSVRLVLDPAGTVVYIGNYHRHKKKK